MKNTLTLLILFGPTIFSIYGQTSEIDKHRYSDISDFHPTDTLFRVYKGEEYGPGVPSGYVNQKGDTVISIGKYAYCFLDTVVTYAIVADSGERFSEPYAIDQNRNRLYEVYWFDNGPDYLEEGLFRIKRNGKIGYANANGEIVIKAQFGCADQFQNGKARVALDCALVEDGEHNTMVSNSWFYINKTGEIIK